MVIFDNAVDISQYKKMYKYKYVKNRYITHFTNRNFYIENTTDKSVNLITDILCIYMYTFLSRAFTLLIFPKKFTSKSLLTK